MEPKSLYEKILQAEKASTIQEITDIENSKQIRVHMPCKVVAVNNNGTTVDVEIQGQEDTGFGFYSKFPILLDLPVIYNNYTSSAYIITPVQIGDTGLVEFLDFNASDFNFNGNVTISSDQNPHSLNNGVFINGYIPIFKQIDIPENKPIIMGLKNKTFTLEVGESGDLIISSLNSITLKSGLGIFLEASTVQCSKTLSCGSGASGVVQAGDKTLNIEGGIITDIS